jgi:hypothetical protein
LIPDDARQRPHLRGYHYYMDQDAWNVSCGPLASESGWVWNCRHIKMVKRYLIVKPQCAADVSMKWAWFYLVIKLCDSDPGPHPGALSSFDLSLTKEQIHWERPFCKFLGIATTEGIGTESTEPGGHHSFFSILIFPKLSMAHRWFLVGLSRLCLLS